MSIAPRVLDRSSGRFSTTVILLLGVLGIFRLPYYFPPRVPLALTPAYCVGFDNGVAVLAVLGVIGAFCLRNLFWRRGTALPIQEDFFSDAAKRQDLPRMPRYIYFLAIAVFVVLSSLLYACLPYLDEYLEASSALRRVESAIHFHQQPYRDLDFPYGPLLLYAPVAFARVGSLFGATHVFSYFLCYLAFQALGLWMLFRMVDRFPIKASSRILIFGVLCLVTFDFYMGLNITLLRHMLIYTMIVVMHEATTATEGVSTWRRIGILVGFGCGCTLAVFSVSVELGVAYLLAQSGYCIHRIVFLDRRWLWALSATLAVLPAWLVLFPGSLDRTFGLNGMCRGFSNYPIYPSAHVVIYLLSLFWLVPVLLRPMATFRPARYAPLFLAIAMLVVETMAASLSRCEQVHVTMNGLGVFLFVLPLLAKYRPRFFPVYTLVFFLVFGVIMRAANIIDAAESLMPVRSALAGKRVVAKEVRSPLIDALGLDDFPSIVAPLALDRHTLRYLMEIGRLQAQYFPDFGDVASPAVLERKLKELDEGSVVLAPESVLLLADMTDDAFLAFERQSAEESDDATRAKLGLTLLFPVRFKTKYVPFHPALEEARFIASRYEVLRRSCGWLIMAKKQAAKTAEGSSRESAHPNQQPKAKPSIDEKYVVKPGSMLNREIRVSRKGTIRFRVEANRPFSVYVITNHGHEVLQGPNPKDIKQEDLLFKQDSSGAAMEDRVTLRPGPSWFLIECPGDKEMDVRFQCFPPGD